MYRLYPYKCFLKDGIANVERLLDSFKVSPIDSKPLSIDSIKKKLISLFEKPSKKIDNTCYIETEYQNKLLDEVLQSYFVADFCLIGPKGCGKSIIVEKLGELLGKRTENITLYQDMTSRDLIQQRTTLNNGDTVWEFSPLVNAALEGKIAILDGIHRIHPSTLSVLHRLVHDRELQLHDGKRLISEKKYNFLRNNLGLSEEHLKKSNILKIHPEFRIVAIGEPPSLQSPTNWFSPEVLSLFLFHEARTLSKNEEMHIITSKVCKLVLFSK